MLFNAVWCLMFSLDSKPGMVVQVFVIFCYLACLAVPMHCYKSINLQVAKNLVSNPEEPLYLWEIITLRTAIYLNFGWVTVASILSIAVCFKKFETEFKEEVIWAIAVLAAAYLIFTINSIIYGGFIVGGVFVFVNFMLFDKYNRQYERSKA